MGTVEEDLLDFSDTEDPSVLLSSLRLSNASSGDAHDIGSAVSEANESSFNGSTAVSVVSEEDLGFLPAKEVAHTTQSELADHQLLSWSERQKTWKAYVPRKDAEPPTGRVDDVRIITYNVWFSESSGRSLRHRALFKLCLTSKREVDVICLQEMTQEAFDELLGIDLLDSDDPLRPMADRSTSLLKKQWLVTEFLPHSLLFKRNIWFGTVILMKRSFAARIADTLRVRSMALPSACNRRLHYIELEHDAQVKLRIATFHLDGAPIAVETRQAQLAATAKLLCSADVPAIICGDSNIVTFNELSGIVSSPYYLIDAMEAIDGESPTWNTTYPVKNGNTARVDLVLLSPGFTAKSGENLGAKPFPLPLGVARPRHVGTGGKVYPSDHLGVFVHAVYLKGGESVGKSGRL